MTVALDELTARDVMTSRVDTIGAGESIHTAIDTMISLGISALPVVSDTDECVGVLTKTDIIQLTDRVKLEAADDVRGAVAAAFFGVGIEEVTDALVEEIMTPNALTVIEEDLVTNIADKMLIHEVHHVPVCNAENRVVGMVSSMDLVKAIRDSYVPES